MTQDAVLLADFVRADETALDQAFDRARAYLEEQSSFFRGIDFVGLYFWHNWTKLTGLNFIKSGRRQSADGNFFAVLFLDTNAIIEMRG